MTKKIKAFTAGMTAALITASALCMNVNAASQDDWLIKYRKGAPSSQYLHPTDTATINIYGGGYITNCLSIDGAYDRRVRVSAPGVAEFLITEENRPIVIPYSDISGSTITFTFWGEANGECDANGYVKINS